MNRPDHQVVQQEQEQAPTTDPPVHIAKPLFFSLKPEEFEPQPLLPETESISN